jgi:hypothetical protein
MKSVFLLLMLLLASLLAAGEADTGSTGPFLNGRYWKRLNGEASKLVYIRAFLDGQRAAIAATATEESRLQLQNELHERFSFAATNMTIGEVADFLTAFFADPSNGAITINNAMQIGCAKAAGTSAGVIETMTVDARRRAAELSRKSDPDR